MPLLSIDIEARFAKFQDALTNIERSTQKSAQNMSRAFDGLKSTLAGLGVGLSIAGLVGVVRNAIDAADHLNDLSKKTGIAVDVLGGLGFAAGQAGGDLESIASAAGKLNKSLAEAAGGNKEFGEAFKALAINIKDSSGQLKKADEVIAEIADKFAGYEDGPEKAAIALRLFGKAGADVIPLLNEGGKALRDNVEYYKKYAGVTQDVAERSDAFNDTLGKINLLSSAFGRTLAADLLPTLQTLADAFLKVKESGSGFASFTSVITESFKAVVVFGANVVYVLNSVKNEIEGIAKQLGALARLDFKGFADIGAKMKVDAAQARKDIDAFSESILNAGKTPTKTAGDFARADRAPTAASIKPRAPILPGTGGAAGKEDDPARKILDGQIKALERLNDQERSILSSRNEFLQAYYQQDLIAVKDYFDGRRKAQEEALRAQEANIDKEIALLKAFKPKDARASAERDNKVEELTDKKVALQKAAGLETIKSFVEEDRAAKDFQRTLQGINAQLLEQKGYAPQAAALQFDLANEPVTKRITTEREAAAQKGDATTVAARDADLSRLSTLRQMSIQRAELNGLEEVSARIQSDLGMATDRAQISQKTGATTELESLRQVSDARLQAAADLKQVADAYEVVARSSGDPRAIQHAKELQVEVQKLAATADLVRDKFEEAFTGPFESFLDKLVSGTATIKDAFKALFADIGANITKMLSRNIAESLFKPDGAFGGIVDSLSGLFGGKAKAPTASSDVAGSIAKAAGGASDAAAVATTTAAMTSLTAATTTTGASFTALSATVPATDASLVAMGASTVTLDAATVALDAAFLSLAAAAQTAAASLAAVSTSGAAEAGSGILSAFAGSGGISMAAANGAVFNTGKVLPFAKGGIPSIVNSPTLFPMAGGQTGLMGEAGPEAIMPLKRDKNGELAVTMVGDRGKVSLMPVTRDGQGRMAVKAFAKGGVFGGEVPRRFASGGIVAMGATMPAARDAVDVANSSSTTNVYVTAAPGVTREQAINQGRNIQRGLQVQLGHRSRNT